MLVNISTISIHFESRIFRQKQILRKVDQRILAQSTSKSIMILDT